MPTKRKKRKRGSSGLRSRRFSKKGGKYTVGCSGCIKEEEGAAQDSGKEGNSSMLSS